MPVGPESCYRRLAVGAVVLKDDRVLLVYNSRPGGGGHWSLPKGSCETGEPLVETLRREVREETGLEVEPVELAFVCEFFVTSRREWYLQHYFYSTIRGGVPGVQDRDPDVTAVKWVPISSLANHLSFRPWLEPLQAWLRDRRPAYYLYDKNEQKNRRLMPAEPVRGEERSKGRAARGRRAGAAGPPERGG